MHQAMGSVPTSPPPKRAPVDVVRRSRAARLNGGAVEQVVGLLVACSRPCLKGCGQQARGNGILPARWSYETREGKRLMFVGEEAV